MPLHPNNHNKKTYFKRPKVQITSINHNPFNYVTSHFMHNDLLHELLQFNLPLNTIYSEGGYRNLILGFKRALQYSV